MQASEMVTKNLREAGEGNDEPFLKIESYNLYRKSLANMLFEFVKI